MAEFHKAPTEAPFGYVGIAFPSAKDPTFAERHPGKSTAALIAGDVPWSVFAEWEHTKVHHRGTEYEDLKALFQERMLAELFRHYPQVKDKVQTVAVALFCVCVCVCSHRPWLSASSAIATAITSLPPPLAPRSQRRQDKSVRCATLTPCPGGLLLCLPTLSSGRAHDRRSSHSDNAFWQTCRCCQHHLGPKV